MERTNVIFEEQEGIEYAICPNCSRMHGLKDEKGEAFEIPNNCKRCGCPMDSIKANAFMDAAADKYGKPAPRVGQAKAEPAIAGKK